MFVLYLFLPIILHVILVLCDRSYEYPSYNGMYNEYPSYKEIMKLYPDYYDYNKIMELYPDYYAYNTGSITGKLDIVILAT